MIYGSGWTGERVCSWLDFIWIRTEPDGSSLNGLDWCLTGVDPLVSVGIDSYPFPQEPYFSVDILLDFYLDTNGTRRFQPERIGTDKNG